MSDRFAEKARELHEWLPIEPGSPKKKAQEVARIATALREVAAEERKRESVVFDILYQYAELDGINWKTRVMELAERRGMGLSELKQIATFLWMDEKDRPKQYRAAAIRALRRGT